MKLVNDIAAPEPVVAMIREFQARYVEGRDAEQKTDYSVTTLLQPPLKVQLERRHDAELEVKVSDMLYALSGTSMHLALEMAGKNLGLAYEVERRLYTDVGGKTISGAIDLIHHAPEGTILYDYKEVSVWEVMRGVKPEKVAQLNLLAELWRRNGNANPAALKLWFRFRDWSPTERLRMKDYPPAKAMTYDVPIWPREEAVAYLRERVALHRAAEPLLDRDIPVCSREERWQETAKWAVMKEGRQSAVRVLESKPEAIALVNEKGKGYYIQERPSEAKRCLYWCPARPVCPFGKTLTETVREENVG